MNEKENRLLHVLQEKKGWVTASELAEILAVSKRQIRYYVSNVNTDERFIQSSNQGYRIVGSLPEKKKKPPYDLSPKFRQLRILRELLYSPPDGCNMFDLAEQLCVSESSIEADLRKLKYTVMRYNLGIRRNNYNLKLLGDERNKRELLRTHFYSDSWDKYLTECGTDQANKFAGICYPKSLKNILLRHNIFANDYLLTNIALCIAIMLDRISTGYENKHLPKDISEADPRYSYAAKDISTYLSDSFAVSLSSTEMMEIETLLSENSSIFDYSTVTAENLSNYIGEEYINITQNILTKVRDHYPIIDFNDDFLTKFTLHVKNIFLRTANSCFAKNPFHDKIKFTYPLVHDISVFIANIFENDYHLFISEDEITYIAFHLCPCIYSVSQERITATFIYVNYYDYHQKAVDLISKVFEENLIIIFTVSVSDYLPSAYHSDLIISTANVRLPEPNIVINPFPVKQDFENIRQRLEQIQLEKKYLYFHKHFLKFFDDRCFMRNTDCSDYMELISIMCKSAIANGLADHDFLQNVLSREQMSSTAFDEVAVPHSLLANVKRSFISVAINAPPLIWGECSKSVRVVMLIGIHKDDRKVFSRIFDFLIEILSDRKMIREIETARDFCHLIDLISSMTNKIDLRFRPNSVILQGEK